MNGRTVWLASYPKSGNTWIRAIVTALSTHPHFFEVNRLQSGAQPFALAASFAEARARRSVAELRGERSTTRCPHPIGPSPFFVRISRGWRGSRRDDAGAPQDARDLADGACGARTVPG